MGDPIFLKFNAAKRVEVVVGRAVSAVFLAYNQDIGESPCSKRKKKQTKLA
jgi:hypothetical protein